MYIGYLWKSRKEETARKTKTWGVDNIKMDLRKIWLRIGTSGGLL
jgi:hypothetical protein